jgi:hypothetical protein
MACCPAREQSVTLMSAEAMQMRQLFQILILLPFLHSPRRFCCRGYATSFVAATALIVEGRPLPLLDQI